MFLEPLTKSGEEVVDAAMLEEMHAFLNVTGPEDFSVPFELHDGETLQVRLAACCPTLLRGAAHDRPAGVSTGQRDGMHLGLFNAADTMLI